MCDSCACFHNQNLATVQVWIKGRVQTVRTKGKTMAFMVLRQREASVQVQSPL